MPQALSDWQDKMVLMISSSFGDGELIVFLSAKIQSLANVVVTLVLFLVFFKSLTELSCFGGLFVAEVRFFL